MLMHPMVVICSPNKLKRTPQVIEIKVLKKAGKLDLYTKKLKV
jgi:hypothetical protein